MPKTRSSLTRRSLRHSKFVINPAIQASQLNLAQLPPEILIKIFDFLSSDDLINLSCLNRTFSSLIDNSSKICKKFVLNLRKSSLENEWIGARKYSQAVIEEEKGIFGILMAAGSELTRIHIDIRSIDLKAIARILNLCPRLNFMKFTDIKSHSVLETMKVRELPKHQNVEVWIENSTPNIFDIFNHVGLQKLTLIGPTEKSDFESSYISSDCGLTFGRFLSSQLHLTDFTLENFKWVVKLFINHHLDQVKFRLKKIRIRKFWGVNRIHFLNFMYNHRDTLEIVDIDTHSMHSDFQRFLSNCTKVRELIFEGNFVPFGPLPKKIEKLTANFSIIRSKWYKNFPNLKELKLTLNTEPAELVEVNFQKLEKCEIHDLSNHRLSLAIGGLKKITLRNLGKDVDVKHVFNERSSFFFEELEIDNCKCIDNIVPMINYSTKAVKVSNMQIDKSTYEDILKRLKYTQRDIRFEKFNITFS